jgi:hypothetical protein
MGSSLSLKLSRQQQLKKGKKQKKEFVNRTTKKHKIKKKHGPRCVCVCVPSGWRRCVDPGFSSSSFCCCVFFSLLVIVVVVFFISPVDHFSFFFLYSRSFFLFQKNEENEWVVVVVMENFAPDCLH